MIWVLIAFLVFSYATSEWLVEFQHPKLAVPQRKFLARVYKFSVILLAFAFFGGDHWPAHASLIWFGTVALGIVINIVALRRINWL